jgi:putative ABC transport system permease protein
MVRDQFAAMPEVNSVSLSYEIPNGNNGGQPLVYKSGTDSTQAVAMQAMISDENYLTTYRIPLRAGAFFDSRGLDSGRVVMNEKPFTFRLQKSRAALVSRCGFRRPDYLYHQGVTRDFHFGSCKRKFSR